MLATADMPRRTARETVTASSFLGERVRILTEYCEKLNDFATADGVVISWRNPQVMLLYDHPKKRYPCLTCSVFVAVISGRGNGRHSRKW